MLPFRKVLCPTDFSGPSQDALSAAVEIAREFSAALRLVHVVPAFPPTTGDPNVTFRVPEYEAALRRDAREKLEDLSVRLQNAGVTPEYAIGEGDPGREIARIAREWGADVIVISTHGETGWRHALFGSVAERVVQLAPCPVLTVRATEATSPEIGRETSQETS
jgi:nucleotide-binding universal stress UspA family protein